MKKIRYLKKVPRGLYYRRTLPLKDGRYQHIYEPIQ